VFVVTGITGNVGGEVARSLLAAHCRVRAVVRDPAKAAVWADQDCEVALADIGDAEALSSAFKGSEGVFVLVPPSFDPAPGFPEARAIGAALRSAIESSRPERVVYLSTIGALSPRSNLLSQHGIIEQTLADVSIPITFLRAAWFMENSRWDVAPAREGGVFPSFLQPLDKPVPMVSTSDIGRLAAELLRETWTGHRVVELEGPSRVTPNQIAAIFSNLLAHSVIAEAVPREKWERIFLDQGMKNPTPRIQMLDGFNEGWIEFEGAPRKGKITIDAALKALV